MHSSVKDRDKYGVFSQKYGQEYSAGVVGHISSDLFVKDTDRCRVQLLGRYRVTCLSKTRTGVERSVIGQVSSYMSVKDTDRCRVQVPSDRSKTRTGVECRCYWTAIEWTVSQRLRQVFGVGALVSQRRKQVWRV